VESREVRSSPPPGRHFSLAIIGGKYRENLGHIMRLALNFGASSIYLVGCKYTRQAADTLNTAHTIPVVECEEIPDIVGTQRVYLELSPDAVPLPEYSHPKRALYIIGPENGSLDVPHGFDCVEIQTVASMNQSQATAVLLYDRKAKEMRTSP
jgi:tRNA(Leu) C34 or U34 (ribose-2'-O)-methylase TrmL